MFKGVVLLFAIFASVVAGIAFRPFPRVHKPLVLLLGFLPFTYLHSSSIHLLWDDEYRGPDKSFEFTAIDLIAWMLYLAVGKQARGTPYRLSQLLYLAVALASIGWAAIPLYAAFSAWQLAKMMLFVACLSRVLQRSNLFDTYLRGLAWGLVWEALICLKGRYLDGNFQVHGTFDHQNSMGMAVNVIAPLMLVLFMSERGKLYMAAVAASVFAVIVSLSRGALAMLVLGMSLAYLAMMTRGINRRKVFISILGLVGVAAVLVASLDSIIERFESAPEASAHSREHYILAARAMLEDSGYGVGFNQFPYWLRVKYAAQLHLEGVKSGVAHHIYWLTLAELGYAGLVTYLLMIAVPLFRALRTAWVARVTRDGHIAAGCAAGMISMHAQGTLEWIARQTVQQYLFWSVAVLCVAAYWRYQDGLQVRAATPEVTVRAWTPPSSASTRHVG